jgi:hypothetical protein
VVQQAADLKYSALKEQHQSELRSITELQLEKEKERESDERQRVIRTQSQSSPVDSHFEGRKVQDLTRSNAHLQAENIAHNITIEYLTDRLRNVTTENERLSGRVDNIVQQLDHEHHYTGGGIKGWSSGGARAVSAGLTQGRNAIQMWRQSVYGVIRRFGGLFIRFGELLKAL